MSGYFAAAVRRVRPASFEHSPVGSGCGSCTNLQACDRRYPNVEENTLNVLLGGYPCFCKENARPR